MEYCGVRIIEYSKTEYCFSYQGRLVRDFDDFPILFKKEKSSLVNKYKAEGFIDCLAYLGKI